MQAELTEQAKKLSIPDRILLVEEIWDTIAEENQAFELTERTNDYNAMVERLKKNGARFRSRMYDTGSGGKSIVIEDLYGKLVGTTTSGEGKLMRSTPRPSISA